jgi:myo-inositol catabolism protein IolC
MKVRGYTKPLYILPFDHRGSFETGMFGWKGDLTAEQTAQIAAAKQVIYEGYKKAIADGAPKVKGGILVDEQFGAAILADALAEGITFACPVEKSGQEEFDFQYGEDFAAHIEKIKPTFSKVLVRYNPEGDEALNQRQAERLKRLSDYLHAANESLFMFELLVPAEKAQLDRVNGDKKTYDHQLRPGLMIGAIEQLQAAGVEPDVWKIEGRDGTGQGTRLGRLHHSGPRRRRGAGAQVADHGGQRSRFHRLCSGADMLLGSVGGVAGQEEHAGRGCAGDCGSLSSIRGYV